jgi:Ca2+-binding RTX toxin-like protein
MNGCIYGDAGSDYLSGGNGDDYLNGSTQSQSVNDGKLDVLKGNAGVDYFRFEEVGNLSLLEASQSDFTAGVDHKP